MYYRCTRYTPYKHQIYTRYTPDIHQIYTRYTPEYKRYTPDIYNADIHQISTRYMPDVCTPDKYQIYTEFTSEKHRIYSIHQVNTRLAWKPRFARNFLFQSQRIPEIYNVKYQIRTTYTIRYKLYISTQTLNISLKPYLRDTYVTEHFNYKTHIRMLSHLVFESNTIVKVCFNISYLMNFYEPNVS